MGLEDYLLDQTPLVGDLGLQEAGSPPPLGPYRTFQVPVADIGALTGLELGPLPAADRLLVAAITAGDEPTGTVRRQLTSYTDIVI